MYICVTNRKLCTGNFLEKIAGLTQRKEIEKIILREKDLQEQEYEKLAMQCSKLCEEHGLILAVNQFISVAVKLQISEVQVSMEQMRTLVKKDSFKQIGVSVHSVEEAKEAEKLGADYLIAGHIFITNCKKGVKPRGLSFLKDVCSAVKIPVYGIGGISEKNIDLVIKTGAVGGCVMSGFMR